MESGKKGKDFFQSFPLDPGYLQEVFGGAEHSDPFPCLHDGCSYAVGNPRQFRDLTHTGPVDVHPPAEEVFLLYRQGTCFAGRRAIGGGNRGGRCPGLAGGIPRKWPQVRRPGNKMAPEGAEIPDKNYQGYEKTGAVARRSFVASNADWGSYIRGGAFVSPLRPSALHAATSRACTGCCPPGPARRPR